MELVALELLEKLNNAGFEAFIVGGAVRNKLLSLPVNDYDITTNATPDEIQKVFASHDFVESGVKHGTVGVIVNGKVYEITTYRVDGDYLSHRRPASVKFSTSLREDLERRDFTVNALAYGSDLQIIDYFGGEKDIKDGILKAVGDPKIRFEEDALRILRAVRFASVYGFEIEENTLSAMIECKSYLQDVSVERIFQELNEAVCGEYFPETLYKCKEVIFEIIPELRKTDGFDQYSYSHDYDVFNHTIAALKICKSRKNNVHWALLFHDIGKPDRLIFDDNGIGHTPGHMERSYEITKPILERLKFPNKLKEEVLTLVLDHDRGISDTKYSVKKYVAKNGVKLTYDLYAMKVSDNAAHSSYGIKRYAARVKQLKYYLDEIVRNNEVVDISDLAIDGNDLLALGITGKDVGKVKNELFDLVLSDSVENKKGELISSAKSIIKNFKNADKKRDL